MPDDGKRLEYFAKLADRASERFESRRTMEWRANISLWTAFGAGAIGILNAPAFSLPQSSAWLLLSAFFALALILFLVYSLVWLPYLDQSFQRESKTSYFWETQIQKLIGVELPSPLQPRQGVWPSAFDVQATDAERRQSRESATSTDEGIIRQRRTHRSHAAQMSVTAVFAVLFVCAIWLKAFYVPEGISGSNGSRGIVVENPEIKGTKITVSGTP